MSFLRRIFQSFRRRREAPAGYSAEVLFANWVEVPAGIREIIIRR